MTLNPTKRSCDQLGVCQGLGADECPNCTSWECQAAVARPAYPFAPGVIEGGKAHSADQFNDSRWFSLSLGDSAKLLGLLVALAMAAGYLVERFA